MPTSEEIEKTVYLGDEDLIDVRKFAIQSALVLRPTSPHALVEAAKAIETYLLRDWE